MKKQSIVLAGAAAIAVVLVFVLATTKFPPAEADAAGTIGAADTSIAGVEPAQRYRAEQIGDDAVTIDDPEIHELLQDDEVLAVIQNPEFQRAIRDGALGRALLDRTFWEALQRTELQRALMERTMSEPLARTEMSRTQREEFARTAFAERTEMQRAVIENPDLARALAQDPALARAIAQDGDLARAVGQGTELQRVFADRQALDILQSLQRTELMRTEGFQRVMARQEFLARMVRDPSFSRTVFERAQMERTQMGRSVNE